MENQKTWKARTIHPTKGTFHKAPFHRGWRALKIETQAAAAAAAIRKFSRPLPRPFRQQLRREE